jgi:hypothetical protein
MTRFVLTLALIISQSANTTPQKGAEDDIREAVFRYIFQHSATQQHPYAKAFYIAVEQDKDPSEQFLKRFVGHQPPVRKRSQSTYSKDGMGVVVDKDTGEGGIQYSVGALKWVSPEEARLEGSYHVGPLFAGGCEYKVILEQKRWMVQGCEGSVWESKLPRARPTIACTGAREASLSSTSEFRSRAR